MAPVASAASALSEESWVPVAGDVFIVDVDSNTGYLLHPDGTYMPFMVATGQQKMVRYLGMTYFAGTPVTEWTAKEKVIQYDRVTFGKSGRFFRLFDDGTKRTHYGIHGFKYIDKWFQEETRYKSFGCIVVGDDILDIIEKTFDVNGKQLQVITTYGPARFVEELALREKQNLNYSMAR